MIARRAVRGVALAGALVLAGAAPASAHANLISSDPASSATLASPPTTLHLTFSEQPDPSLSAVELLAGGGTQVSLGTPSASGATSLDVPITGDMPDGVYTVSWSVVSEEDGHATASAFAFGVGVKVAPGAATPAATTTSGPTALAVASKAAMYAGLMLLVAIAVVGMGMFGGAPKARPRIGAWAGAVGLVGTLGFVWAQQRATGAPLGRYLGSDAARTPLLLLAAAAAAAILTFVATQSSQRWLPWAAGAAAAIALALRAHSGHAAAAPMPLLAQAEQWVHIIAGACWAGGLLLLVLLIRERRDDPPVALARRYSNVALGAIVVVVGTGALRAITELGGLDDVVRIWSSSYGVTLAVKVAVVIGVIALGAINRYRSMPRLARDRRPLLRIASVELAAVVGILGLTATLTSFPPPATTVAAAPVASATVTMTGSDFATSVRANVTVSPAQPGPNLYRATITGYDTGQTVAADGVVLQLASVTRPDLPGAAVKLHPDADGWVGQALDPSISGTFRVTAQIRTGADVVEVPLTLITRSTGQITTTPAPGGETTALAAFDDGVRIEATSSASNPVQVHVTAFAADGNEMSVGSLALVGSPATGTPTRLAVQRFTKGHFGSSVDLPPGVWTFDAIATTKDGRSYQCTWSSPVTG